MTTRPGFPKETSSYKYDIGLSLTYNHCGQGQISFPQIHCFYIFTFTNAKENFEESQIFHFLLRASYLYIAFVHNVFVIPYIFLSIFFCEHIFLDNGQGYHFLPCGIFGSKLVMCSCLQVQ